MANLLSSRRPARPSRRGGKSSVLPLLLSAILLLSIRPSASSRLCPRPPIQMKRHLPSSAAAAIRATTFLPRGGGGSSSTTTASDSIDNNATNNPLSAALSSFARTIIDARSHLVAAAAARCISIFGMYPVDTIKTRMQMKQGDAFRAAGLYKGVAGSLAGQVPYGVLTFGSYEIYKQTLLDRFPNVKPALVYALAAIMGDVTGSGWLCPSEVVKQQLQAGIYPNTKEAVKGIWNRGGIGGFYQGFTGGLARDVPFRVAQLTTFEVTKSLYLRAKRAKKANSSDGESSSVSLSALEAAACGAASGSLSAAVTNPLDRIKTLMMTDTTGAYGGSVVKCAARIARDDGLGGLFAGVVPRVAYIAPSVCIFFVTYEFVQQRMTTASEKKKE